MGLLLIFITSCGGGNTDNPIELNTSHRLSEDDFVINNLNNLSIEEFAIELNQTDEFLSEEQALIEIPDATTSCIQDKLGKMSIQINDNDTYELFINDTNLAACFTIDGFKLDSVIASWYVGNMSLTDSDGNIIIDRNVEFNDLSQFQITHSNFRRYMLMSGVYTLQNVNYKFEITFIASSNEKNQFDSPCQREHALTNCTYQEVMRLVMLDYPSENINKKIMLNAEGLNIISNETYFADGRMLFEIDDWIGSMNYQSDASQAPTYTATNGENTVTGTFNYNSGEVIVAKQHNFAPNNQEEFSVDMAYSVNKRVKKLVELLTNVGIAD